MNWQLLNPIKLFGVTASLAGRFAPHATKKRLAIAAALGLAGVGSAGAYYWWKKPRGEQSPAVAKNLLHADDDAAPALQPIPDDGEASGEGDNPSLSPPPSNIFNRSRGGNRFVAAGGGEESQGAMDNGGQQAGDAGATGDGANTDSAGNGNAGGEGNEGGPGAGNPLRRPASRFQLGGGEGGTSAGQPTDDANAEANTAPSTEANALVGDAGQGGEAMTQQQGDPAQVAGGGTEDASGGGSNSVVGAAAAAPGDEQPVPGADPSANQGTDANGGVQGGAGGTPSGESQPSAEQPQGNAPAPANVPDAGVGGSGGIGGGATVGDNARPNPRPAVGPTQPSDSEPRRPGFPGSSSLAPVAPARPQPSPPEEHVRVPDEASPSLAPGGFNPGGRAPGPGLLGTPEPNRALDPANTRSQPGGLRGGIGGGAGANAGSGAGIGESGNTSLGNRSAANGFAPNTQLTPLNNVNEGADASVTLSPGELPPAISPSPGAKQLEGVQKPALTLEKSAPQEIQVGVPANFVIKVRNVGRATAQQVTVFDQVPQGTRLIDANPPCTRGPGGSLRWQLGTLAPDQDATITMQLMPEQEGEIGSVAQVSFNTQASVRTVATRPQVAIEHKAPARTLIGQNVTIQLAVSNSGSGAASNLIVECQLPEGLTHPAGNELEYPVGTLRPGETKRFELVLKAVRPGSFQCGFLARTDAQNLAEDRISVDVLAPQLQVGVAGPKVRYLDRQATYSVSVHNPGTAAATTLDLVASLPRGVKFVSADNQGQYDSQRHAVVWGLAELPAGVTGTSQMVVVPTEPGEQRLKVEARADLGLQSVQEHPVLVETLSELQFTVSDSADPIEVGSDTVYEVRIMNRGSRSASNVRLAVELPQELEAVGGDGATRISARNGQLSIEPLPRLAPNGQVAYQIRVRGVRKGDPRVRVQLSSDESPTP
ncbi:MAG TPA: hypothetical protein PLV92_12560, partial [Pirellulaceae bacterium]|nr:hypothetical protein [Pirellulaceae bacterium]